MDGVVIAVFVVIACCLLAWQAVAESRRRS
jgi:hypothetical protein